MIAEYQPQTNSYYYYASDQVNSSRVVTDGAGTVVYSVTHTPYGDTEREFVKSYDPKPKFSGKEREEYSNWDYFGARYYDHWMFRFTSVDPVINKEEALTNPQLWNLYSYCRNNPITYFDPDGRDMVDSISNFVAGFGDTISFGLTGFVRNQLQKLHGINSVDTESVAYVSGDTAGMVFDAFAGGKVVEGVLKKIGPLKRWIRIGKSFSKSEKAETIGLRWGSNKEYAKKIKNLKLRKLNENLHKLKLSGKNWRVQDSGHFHFWKKNR